MVCHFSPPLIGMIDASRQGLIYFKHYPAREWKTQIQIKMALLSCTKRYIFVWAGVRRFMDLNRIVAA